MLAENVGEANPSEQAPPPLKPPRVGTARRGPPQLAVVIPLYQQAIFVADALLSVRRQTMADQVVTVVVNDGCPDPRSDLVSRAFAGALGADTVYVRTSNRGVAAARNHALELALRAWPSIQAVFPLDADNVL